MTRSALARSCTPPSRTGRHGRLRKPTPPLGCMIGHRLPRSSCDTTCLIVPRTEEQSRDTLGATAVHLSPQPFDRLDALSRPTLGFPGDVMREAAVVSGIYGAQLADIDDPRAQAVRRTTGT